MNESDYCTLQHSLPALPQPNTLCPSGDLSTSLHTHLSATLMHRQNAPLRRVVSFNNASVFAAFPLGETESYLEAIRSRGAGRVSSDDNEGDDGGVNIEEQLSNRAGFATKKLAIVMVGLPARGKSHIARCLERYLNWLGFTSSVFNVGNYRRRYLRGKQAAHFFDPENEEGIRARMQLAVECLNDMLNWFQAGGLVGIYDATNSTRDRRRFVKVALESEGVRVLFLESVCTDDAIVEKNIMETKLHSPDYLHINPEQAAEDFRMRIRKYHRVNETVQESENCSFIKVINVGKQLILHDIQGFVQAKIVSFLLNSHITPRSIYLSRSGESEWNVAGQLGGDSHLTARGRAYARALSKFISTEFEQGEEMPLVVWTSQLKRARETVEHILTMNLCWRALNEIDAGVCEGMTYQEVAEKHPDVSREREKEKLRYRYPGGESYIDVIHRLEPVILELERHRGPILIVAHNAVIRTIYAYCSGKSREECPFIDIPLHTVFKLNTGGHGAMENMFNLDTESDTAAEQGDICNPG